MGDEGVDGDRGERWAGDSMDGSMAWRGEMRDGPTRTRSRGPPPTSARPRLRDGRDRGPRPPPVHAPDGQDRGEGGELGFARWAFRLGRMRALAAAQRERRARGSRSVPRTGAGRADGGRPSSSLAHPAILEGCSFVAFSQPDSPPPASRLPDAPQIPSHLPPSPSPSTSTSSSAPARLQHSRKKPRPPLPLSPWPFPPWTFHHLPPLPLAPPPASRRHDTADVSGPLWHAPAPAHVNATHARSPRRAHGPRQPIAQGQSNRKGVLPARRRRRSSGSGRKPRSPARPIASSSTNGRQRASLGPSRHAPTFRPPGPALSFFLSPYALCSCRVRVRIRARTSRPAHLPILLSRRERAAARGAVVPPSDGAPLELESRAASAETARGYLLRSPSPMLFAVAAAGPNEKQRPIVRGASAGRRRGHDPGARGCARGARTSYTFGRARERALPTLLQ